MNKNILIGAALVVLAGAGYYQFSMKPAQEAAAMAASEAQATADAATKAAEEAAAAATKAADDAAAAAAAAAATATTAATDAMAALDPAAFDAAKITALIDASALDDAIKTTLKAGVTAAAADPSKVASAVAAVKTALGM